MWLGSKTSEIRLQTANRTDERVHLMNEIIAGIHVIKMYAWELFFNNSIKHARKYKHLTTKTIIRNLAILKLYYLLQERN